VLFNAASYLSNTVCKGKTTVANVTILGGLVTTRHRARPQRNQTHCHLWIILTAGTGMQQVERDSLWYHRDIQDGHKCSSSLTWRCIREGWKLI